MNRYQLREWLRYRWDSIGRHGMHSPFVYRMVDEALRPALKRIPQPRYRNASGKALELENDDRGLLRRIIHYTQVQEIQFPDSSGHFPENALFLRDHGALANPDPGLIPFRRLFLLKTAEDELDLSQWPSAIAALSEELQDNDLIVVPSIFQSQQRNAAWESLCNALPQRLCVDLFRLGLLFFKEEFQVPQRFRVKFPL